MRKGGSFREMRAKKFPCGSDFTREIGGTQIGKKLVIPKLLYLVGVLLENGFSASSCWRDGEGDGAERQSLPPNNSLPNKTQCVGSVFRKNAPPSSRSQGEDARFQVPRSQFPLKTQIPSTKLSAAKFGLSKDSPWDLGPCVRALPCTLLRIPVTGSAPRGNWGRALLLHTWDPAYGCFLPDLTRFAGPRCGGPNPSALPRKPDCPETGDP